MENNRCRSMEKGCFRQINKWDIAAILLGLCLLVFFVITAGNGVGMPDEAFYYTVPQRILNGDRLFVDEWHLTQLASLFSVLPYWIFTTVTGGTEGLILYMRLIFTAVNMLFYAYLYCRLRRYGFWGLLSAFLFCAILPEISYSISYFTVSSMAITVVCIIFFTGKAPGIPKSLAAGVCFAAGVVAEPLLFLLYPVYTAAVIIRAAANRKKREANGSFLRFRVWFFFSAGGFAVLAALMLFLFRTGALQALPETLPYLFTGTEFNESNFFEPARLKAVCRFFGAVSLAFFAVSIVVFLVCAVLGKLRGRARFLVFALTVVSFTVSSLIGLIAVFNGTDVFTMQYFVLYHDLPILLTVPIWYFLCEKKDPRLFSFWVCGALYSVLVDISSDVVIGSGGRIAQIAGFLMLAELAPELKAAFRRAGKTDPGARLPTGVLKKAFAAVCAVGLVAFTAWNAVYIGIEGFFRPAEKVYCDDGSGHPYGNTLEAGPFKNLKTNDKIRKIYLSTLRDLDGIVEEARDDNFVTFGLNPYIYLYADLPYACFSAWNQNPMERSCDYWQLFEERKPGYIYISYYPFMYWKVSRNYNEDIEQLKRWLGECDVVKGEAGYVIRVRE